MTDTINQLKEAGYTEVGKEEIKKVWGMFLNLSEQEIKAISEDSNRPQSERILAKALLGKYNYMALNDILDRVHGKADNKVEISGPVKIKVKIEK